MRNVKLAQVCVRDLRPGDVIDAANYRYRSTPVYQESVQRVESPLMKNRPCGV